MSLVATCHDVIWTATELESEQIHEYLLILKQGSDKQIEPSRDAPPLLYAPYRHVGRHAPAAK